MTQLYRISIFCPDRIGLVSAITGKLFDLGINLADTTFAVLGTGAELTAVCEAPRELKADDIARELSLLDELQTADIAVKPFELESIHGPTANITHMITVKGGDNPGLVARLSEVFMEFNANIVRLNSEKIPGNKGDIYEIVFAVWIPKNDVESCLATIENTANSLQMKYHIEKPKS